ncbi:5-bromo-4-chloroindolyl phosphate hydrolysis family protein [Acidihalobacter ferrooxydans]|uniref:5-bromo-4-chloroindolyl phosphate hydrolysis family protein n=1 Tax=Acidihalobacter ferrooxydans TaxID=1765967 RepID=UPI0018DC62A7|nr:5-bromo-4-chloroindolyl phosphate hydrolysis family protein [Acidihalobacter ferrooxydans]
MLLGFLLVPLFASLSASLFTGHYRLFLLKLAAFAIWSAAAMLISKGIREEMDYEDALLARAPVWPLKGLGALVLGSGVFYLGWVVAGEPLWRSLFVGALATLGAMLNYGLDPRQDKLPDLEDVDPHHFLKSLEQARASLAVIRGRNGRIHDSLLHNRINRAARRAEEILDVLAQNPRKFREARKFLVVYIDGVSRVTDGYLAVEEEWVDPAMRDRLYRLMADVDQRFYQELDRLRAGDRFDLDVQIEALKQQLKER